MRRETRSLPNQTGVNNLLVFDVPMEFGFKLGELPVRIFGEFARNFSGDTRAVAAGHPDKTRRSECLPDRRGNR